MNYKIQKALPVILSIVSSIGVALTTYLCAKQTLKYSDELKELKKTDNKKKAVPKKIELKIPKEKDDDKKEKIFFIRN